MIYGSAFGWASEVQKPQRFVRLSGGLLKYRNSKDSFGGSGGLPKYGKTKFHSAIRVGFRSIEKPSFIRPFGWASEVWKNQVSFGRSGGLPKYRNSKDSFGHSGGLPKYGKTKFRKFETWIGCSEERENSKIRSGGLPCSEERENSKDSIPKNGKPRNQDSIRWASEERKPKDSIGWASEKRKPKDKDSCGGLLTNENPKIKIRKCGGLPTNENPKIKIRSGGFCLSKERKKLKIRSVSSEEWKKPRFIQWASEEQRKTKIHKKVEPRFVLTNLGLVSWVDSDKQKKTKDSFGGFPKDQDFRTLGEWQRTAAKKSAKVRPALDHKLA
ncbi:unnamed protein product [Rhizophagus irregularis]|nr:unnamed protein product [Rhizophagus irregularis]